MSQHKQSPVSLQKKLVKSSVLGSIFVGLIALFLLMGMTIYHTMSVQDDIMDEIADMLLMPDLSQVTNTQLDDLSDEFKIQYQLSDQDKILTQSEDFNLTSPKKYLTTEHEAFDYLWYEHRLWRTYTHTKNGLVIYLIQPLKYRFENLWNSVAIYVAILFAFWFMQWLFLHLTIRRQFKSFNLLATDIAEKGIQDLTPIQPQNIQFAELQPIIQQLNQLLSRLEQSLEAEQRFTADASHELRSPLSAIQLRLQVLKRKYAEDVGLKKDLNQIQQDINRSTAVLENLLLLARLDPENVRSLPKSKLNLNELTQEVLQALKPFIEEKQIHIDCYIAHDVSIYAHKELMFTCLRNIVDNAIRYIPMQNQIDIMIEQQTADNIEIRIEDHGDTVTEETIQRLGERFYRALGTKTVGSGLGISICKKIIDLHQGQLSFQQNQYGGLTVNIHLPILT